MKKYAIALGVLMCSAIMVTGCGVGASSPQPKQTEITRELEEGAVYTSAVQLLDVNAGYYEVTCHDEKTIFILNNLVCTMSDFSEKSGSNPYDDSIKLLKVKDAGTDHAQYTYIMDPSKKFDIQIFGENLSLNYIRGDGRNKNNVAASKEIDNKGLGLASISYDGMNVHCSYVPANVECPEDIFTDKEKMVEYLSENMMPDSYKLKHLFADPKDKYDEFRIFSSEGNNICIVDDVIYTDYDLYYNKFDDNASVVNLEQIYVIGQKEGGEYLGNFLPKYPVYAAPIYEGMCIKTIGRIGGYEYYRFDAKKGTVSPIVENYAEGYFLTTITCVDGEVVLSYEAISELPEYSLLNEEDSYSAKVHIAEVLQEETGMTYYASIEDKMNAKIDEDVNEDVNEDADDTVVDKIEE